MTITPERAARILRAHAGNLDNHLREHDEHPMSNVTFDLLSATSMIATLLAEFFDSSVEMPTEQEQQFLKGFEDGRGLPDRE